MSDQTHSIQFEIPGQPVAKGRPIASTINGRVSLRTPAKTVRYESTVSLYASQAMAGKSLIDGPVALHVHAYFQVPASWSQKKRKAALAGQVLPTGRPDSDNLLKAVSDALNGVVFNDDAQAVDAFVRKRYAEAPCVLVLVERLV